MKNFDMFDQAGPFDDYCDPAAINGEGSRQVFRNQQASKPWFKNGLRNGCGKNHLTNKRSTCLRCGREAWGYVGTSTLT